MPGALRGWRADGDHWTTNDKSGAQPELDRSGVDDRQSGGERTFQRGFCPKARDPAVLVMDGRVELGDR